MKIKLITAAIALLTVGVITTAVASQGENNLAFTLNANVTKATPGDDVRFRLYNHNGTELPSDSLTMSLQEVLDTDNNLVFGSTGNIGNDRSTPEIAPDNIYVLEVYSQSGQVEYSKIGIKTQAVSLDNGTDDQHVITAKYAILHDKPSTYAGPAGTVPADAITRISSAQYFDLLNGESTTDITGAQKGTAFYMPFSFFGHLPNWGDDISQYTPGDYTKSGQLIITAHWA